MTCALISDIHGNLEAATAVLKDIRNRRIDTIYCLGDVIGYGPNPVECLDLVTEACDVVLMGNHEYYALGLIAPEKLSSVARESSEWTQAQLREEDIALLSDLELQKALADVQLVHSSPCQPESWTYILDNKQARIAIEHMTGTLCFFGHTHIPAIHSISADGRYRSQVGHDFSPEDDARYLVNVGSVGQPRDNDPRACYVTFDIDTRDVEYHRLAYDIEATQDKMVRAGLPGLLVERLKIGQ